ncbi:hypothetical protein FACS189413_12430 [Bacteroidia bacterium]|nr:hypothetical protein FACS189413_12430 [Bacteroidia bacterium]
MKNLDLNACGVQEMSSAQMRAIEGGGWLKTLKKVAEVIGLADMVAEFCDGLRKGYKKVTQHNKNNDKTVVTKVQIFSLRQ